MDMDSFILELNADDVYKDMKEDEDIYEQVIIILITHSFFIRIKRLVVNLKMN